MATRTPLIQELQNRIRNGFPPRLRGRNLQGLPLNEMDLSHADLRGANLQRANLAGSNLDWANLEGANLEGANLLGASLCHAVLDEARAAFACLGLTDLRWCRMNRADVREASLVGARTEGLQLWKTDLRGARLSPEALRPILRRLTPQQRAQIVIYRERGRSNE